MFELKPVNGVCGFSFLSEKLNFNKMPKPFFEMTKEEFERSAGVYMPNYIDIGQVMDKEDYEKITGEVPALGSHVRMTYFYYDTFGLAIAIIPQFEDKTGKLSFISKYFRLGCKHEHLTPISNDGLVRTFKCEDCGSVIEEQTGV